MNLLVIDAGNSRCKYAVGESDKGFPNESIQTISHSDIENRFRELDDIGSCVVASVHDGAWQRIRDCFSSLSRNGNLAFLSAINSCLALNVAHQESLGSDRIAAATGAYYRTQSQTIIVDSGTATTIDLVDDQGEFQGGVIFPGVNLALDALAAQTDKLPRVNFDCEDEPSIPGRDTASAIRGGVYWSLIGGVERIVANLRQQVGAAPVLITGGNGEKILRASSIENGTYTPALVLEGLWQVGLDLGKQTRSPDE